MADRTIDSKDGLTSIAVTRTPPKDPNDFVREQAAALETARVAHLADRKSLLSERSKLLQAERDALAKDDAPPMALALIDRALASAGRHIEAVDSTLRAVKQAPPLDEAGYAMTGVLADANGKGPANGEVSLSVKVGAVPTKIGTARIAADGMFYLAVPAAATKQFTGQSASVDITIGGKPYAANTNVTITPGLIEVVTLPVLNGGTPVKPDPKPVAAAPNAIATPAASEVQTPKATGAAPAAAPNAAASGTPTPKAAAPSATANVTASSAPAVKAEETKPKTRVAARTVKKDQPKG
jgi:hypothetical protein